MVSRGDLSFQVVDLPDEGVDVEGEVAFSAMDVEDDGVFTFPEALSYALHLAPLDDGILVRGRASGRAVRVCDRCLEPCVVELSVPDVCHLFEHVGRTVVDLTEALREDILLALPQALLCRADCRGLCPQCGRNRNEADCGCHESGADGDADPWGALDDLELGDRA